MKTTSSCVLNSTAILVAIRSRESEILFEFNDNSRSSGVLGKSTWMRTLFLAESDFHNQRGKITAGLGTFLGYTTLRNKGEGWNLPSSN